MKDVIVFIDDQKNVRDIIGKRLQRLFGDIAQITALEPSSTTDEMLQKLFLIENIVSYIVDENLMHSGGTDYQGVGLISKIREINSKVPIYVLTSDVSAVDPLFGDIEFVIDKVDFNKVDNKEKFLKRFVRHLSTYKDIKNDFLLRFEELLLKSLTEPLTASEKDEFESLNTIRSKILMDEGCISEKDVEELNMQSEKLDDIEMTIREMMNEK